MAQTREKEATQHMTYLLTSDWHLTDKVEDEYRWKFINSLPKHVIDHNVKHLYMLGDLCEQKDRHSAKLVNSVVQAMYNILKYCSVTIIAGNHDFPLDDGLPFWNFLSCLSPYNNNELTFEDEMLMQNKDTVWLIPYRKRFDLAPILKAHRKPILMHQSVSGAVHDNLHPITNGISLDTFRSDAPIYSGHLHTPQTVRNVTYVGAPYPIDYGDDYQTRMLLVDDNFEIIKPIILKGVRKLRANITYANAAEELSKLALRPNDKLKIEVSADLTEAAGWPGLMEALQQQVIATGADLISVALKPQKTDKITVGGTSTIQTVKEVFDQYVKENNIPDNLVKRGETLLEKAKNA
jgi:DNA repair exonuclease SbcCD nuclease subunit